jgi:hypothetical protein
VFGRARIRRTRRGMYRVDLPPPERDVLARLLPQLRQLVSGEGDDDGRSRRLFPTAYAQDAEADADYQRLMREELVASRLEAIDTVEESLQARELDESQLVAWMASVNSLRLVLGTMLDVSEDLDLSRLPPDSEDLESFALYAYLSALLEEIVEALTPA